MSHAREDSIGFGARTELRVLHHDTPRKSAADKVSGRAIYSHDRRVPGLLYGRLVSVPYGRAKFDVDLSPALDMEGVVAGVILREPGETRFLGQAVAAIAAETPELADEAARRVELSLEPLPASLTPEAAVEEGAAPVRRGGNRSKVRAQGDPDATEAALAASDAVIEASYRVPVEHHVCLETHGVVCDWRGGDSATIYASTQMAFGIPGAAAKALGIPAENVRCIVHHMGGGFGSKFALDTPGRAACLLSKETRRPVHLLNSRTDEFNAAGNRSGSRQTVRAGATKDGKLKALSIDIEKLGGVGPGAGGPKPYHYEPEASAFRESSIYTHTDASRAMRAPGHPQVCFVTESVMDELAYAIGADLVEFRKQNLSDPVWHRQLDRVAREIGWADHPHRTAPGRGDGWTAEGIGFAITAWGGGGHGGAEATVRIGSDGGVQVSIGIQDLGTGVRTLVAMIAAEELGLDVDRVVPLVGDTLLPPGVGSGGSVTTGSVAPPVKLASREARRALAELVASDLGCPGERVAFEGGRVFDRENRERGLAFEEACSTLPRGGVTGHGAWDASLQGSGVHGAQAARVHVDLMTGRVRVLKMVACQDSGLVLNPLTWRSQVNGAMIQGLGQALLEERVVDQDLSIALNAQMQDYKIPGTLEIPVLVALIDEEDTREVPIGVGEPPVIPGAAAIANAVHNACGARVRSLPLTPDKVLMALAELPERS